MLTQGCTNTLCLSESSAVLQFTNLPIYQIYQYSDIRDDRICRAISVRWPVAMRTAKRARRSLLNISLISANIMLYGRAASRRADAQVHGAHAEPVFVHPAVRAADMRVPPRREGQGINLRIWRPQCNSSMTLRHPRLTYVRCCIDTEPSGYHVFQD